MLSQDCFKKVLNHSKFILFKKKQFKDITLIVMVTSPSPIIVKGGMFVSSRLVSTECLWGAFSFHLKQSLLD